MRYLRGSLACGLVCVGALFARAQGDPIEPLPWGPWSIGGGVGTTILPTPVLATQRLGGGGGGYIGGNVTLNLRATRDISQHLRIPLSISLAFLRGNESFYHADAVAPGDTVVHARVLANRTNVISIETGLEYFEKHELVSPYAGISVGLHILDSSRLNLSIPELNQVLFNQALAGGTRLGLVLRVGAEFPLFDFMYYDVSAELGAFNLSGGGSEHAQLFTPTQESINDYASRVNDGKTGEAVVTYFRLLVKGAWKF